MPTKDKYDRIKSDPVRYEQHKQKKNEEQNRFRRESCIRYLTYKTNASVKGKGNFTPWELWCKAKKQKLICVLSGRRLTNENMSVDHIIPLSQGGMNNIDNVQLVVKEVNFAKHCLLTEEFLSLCEDVIRHYKVGTAAGT